MLRSCILLLFLGIMPAVCSAQTGDASKAHNLKALTTLLKNGTVAKIQVLHLSDSVMTRVAVSPQSLRTFPGITRKIFDKDLIRTFDPVFSGIVVKHENHPADARWGVLFYDSQNREIAALFVDSFGQYGYLNDETVSFGMNLATRLHKATGIPRG